MTHVRALLQRIQQDTTTYFYFKWCRYARL